MREPHDAALFAVKDVDFSYRQTMALDKLSLTVQEGERLALLGANGSGKSTLLRLLDGLIFAQSGEVRFAGRLLTEELLTERNFVYEFRRKVGLVFQNPDVQLFNPTVFDELAFGPLQMRWTPERIHTSIDQILAQLEISDLRHRAPHQLSGGERKRVALACILILDPDVLLLDEPTAALDPRSRGQILNLLVSWRGSRKTAVIATHDLDSLEEIADRCVVFDKGRAIAQGTPLEILHDVDLLQRTGLLAAHAHSHPEGEAKPHPHIHRKA